MKFERLVVMLAVLFCLPALADMDNRTVKPEKNEATVLVGENFTLDAGPGGSCGEPSFPFDLQEGKKSCDLYAANTGKTEILVKTVKGTKKITLSSVRASELPRVKIGDLTANPDKYLGKMVMLEGENIGWGQPKKAKIWNPLGTRSDWILEDDTGAVYITRSVPPKFPVARAVVIPAQDGKDWYLPALRVEEAMVVLKAGVVNEVRVGQGMVVLAYPTKSHVPEVRVQGPVVKLEKNDREEIFLRGVAEGEATAELYLHWWREFPGLNDGPDKDKPVETFQIKVVK